MPEPAKDLFDLVRSIELPMGDYAIFGSGPLIIRGIVEATNDIDVLARGKAWRQAQEVGELTYLPDFDVEIVSCFGGMVTIGTRWAIGDIDAGRVINSAETIAGLPFAGLEYVIAYKEAAGRPKDREHLRLLERSMLDAGT